MFKINKYTKPEPELCEIFQSLELKFSFARVDGNTVDRIHDWVKCRDFLGDVIWGTADGKRKVTYGFVYDPAKDIPIHTDKMVMLLKFPKEMKDIFLQNLGILAALNLNNHQFGSGIEQTDDPNVLLLFAAPFWQQNIPVLSFYTFILKIMCVKYGNPADWQKEFLKNYKHTPEAVYLAQVGQGIDIMYTSCYKIFKDEGSIHGYKAPHDTITNVHNYSGFVSTCGKNKTNHINSHQERFRKYVEDSAKTAPRVAHKPKKVAEAVNPATETCC